MLMETCNQSINNDHVKIFPETLDGSGTSEPADLNPKIFDQSESSTSSEGLIDITLGCEREDPEVLGSDNNNYPLTHNNGTNSILIPAETPSFGCERKDPDILGSDSDNYPLTHISGTNSILVPAETSSSSSSLESSSNDLFRSRKVRFAESAACKSASEDEQSDVSRESSIKSEAGQSSPTSTSQFYNPTYGHMDMRPTVSPPVQVMDRSSRNDRQSERIPSSAFASKNSIDWSYASNDSLFSIQLGNTSLTRDQVILSQEELTESGELNMFHPLPSVLVEDTDTGRKSVQMEDSLTTETLDEDLKLEENLSKKNSHPADSYEPSNVSGPSHGNGTSSHPSSLTIKKKCPYSKLPSCNFRCSMCCLVCPSCCLTEKERLSYVKTDSPQPQSSNNSSEVTSSSTSNCCNCWNWFQCFSWSCCTCSQTENPRQQSSNISSEVTSSSTSNYCNWCQCFSWSCWTGSSQTESPRQQSYDKGSKETSSSTCNYCNWCQCFSWSCCTGSSQTEFPRQQSCDKASKETSSLTSSYCNWCQCFSWSCCTGSSQTEFPRQQSCDNTSKESSSSTSNYCNWCQCFSWSCCTSSSQTEFPRQLSCDKTSKETSSSTSNYCNWCQCFSWSCCTGSSQTEFPRQQSCDEASKETSSLTSSYCNWCQCFSWSCCTGSSQTEFPRQQSCDKETSSVTSKCYNCSWGKCCCWCC